MNIIDYIFFQNKNPHNNHTTKFFKSNVRKIPSVDGKTYMGAKFEYIYPEDLRRR